MSKVSNSRQASVAASDRRTSMSEPTLHPPDGAPAAGDSEVGYGRPPKDTRFKPGQSGNPKGRRKLSKAPATLLEEALSALISVTEGGVTRSIELRQALFKSMLAKAIKGDTRAAALVIKLMEQFGMTKATGEAVQPVIIQFTAEDMALL